MDRCRLVKYDHINDVLDRSFDLDTDDAHSTLSQLLGERLDNRLLFPHYVCER